MSPFWPKPEAACVCETGMGAVIFKYFKKNTHIVKGLLKVSENNYYFSIPVVRNQFYGQKVLKFSTKAVFFSQTFVRGGRVFFLAGDDLQQRE